MLTGRILSILGTEYIFKDANNQTVNLLIKKRCAIVLRTDKLASAESTAFVEHENDGKKTNSTKVNSCKSTKRGADRAKQNFLCNQCKQLGHWAAECPQKQQYAGDRGGKSAAKKNAGAFLVHVMGASRANSVDAYSWYCDSGATGHITPNKQHFVSNKIRQSCNDRAWQKKCAVASIR
jgi:hypothetical protein